MADENFKITSLETLDEYLSHQDNSQNSFYMSDIPNVCKEFPCVLGIDEAGRGPVLGPMVYGTAFCPINSSDLLVKLECDDSKALTAEKRELIFGKMCESNRKIGWAVEVISPNTICNNMLRRNKYTLNQISMDSAVGLIRAAIKNDVKIAQIYVDTVGQPESYQKYLEGLFPGYKITVAKKADSTYPIVSAASICAKVARDHALQVWKFPEGIDLPHTAFGSGYPNDPVTKTFLEKQCDPVFGFPQLVRFSWSTSETALKSTAYHVEWPNVEEEPSAKSTTSITAFFSPKSKPKEKPRHEFFKNRFLTSTKEL